METEEKLESISSVSVSAGSSSTGSPSQSTWIAGMSSAVIGESAEAVSSDSKIVDGIGMRSTTWEVASISNGSS